MKTLSKKTCEPCTKTSQAVDLETLEQCLGQLPDWQVLTRDGIQLLQKSFVVKPYSKALIFVQAIGNLAEQENHHPEILLEWGKVTVSWWTHTINGLHINDCILAARCEDMQ